MDFLNRIPKRSKKIAWRIIDGEAITILLETYSDEEKLNIFNETATRIWELVDGKHTVKAIASKLIKEYDVEVCKATAKIGRLIDDMLDKGLIYFSEEKDEKRTEDKETMG